MPRSLPLRRRMSSAARWPLGLGLTSWRYLWRTVPMHRKEEPGDPEADRPPALPPGIVRDDDIQRHEEGTGPLFHRTYRTRIREARVTAEELLERIAADPDSVAPSEFASFMKLHGEPGRMDVGDEYRVRMAGPWDGPVRVAERTPASFRLVTLDGHLEAGQIRFSAQERDDMIVFEIESWARSSSRLVHLMYDRLRMAKEVQLHMWVSMLQRVAEVSGGRVTGGIDIHTRRVEEPASDVTRRLAALRDRRVNFDPDAPHPESEGWRVDEYREALPSEPPGPPVDGGPFQIAQTLLRDYRVADPRMVRAHYDLDAPLEGRDMLLELRFLCFRTFGSCRVGAVMDEQREVSGRPVQVWGWPYQTLEGHIEQGEMSWEVWKWLDTGEVEFRVHSYSRMVGARNPFTIAGVRLFGQRQRRRYLTSACRRMRELTERALRREHPAGAEARSDGAGAGSGAPAWS